uniref:hyaluronan-binding protein 2-like n=1 Tax=Styela clava TaxID=7725 RepID=UPI00193A5A39|nr:hyaluronan-binding protein 2-like [Styela clava]
MASLLRWKLYIFLLIGTIAYVSSQGHRSVTRAFNPSLRPGDVITIQGTGSTRSVGLIRLHSEKGTCDSNPRLRSDLGQAPLSCNPLVLKLLTRKHKILFLKKDVESENKDVLIKTKLTSGLMRRMPYTITITVTYTGYDVQFNNDVPIEFVNRNRVGDVNMIRATSGNYDNIMLKRGANIPLNEPDCGQRGANIFRSKWARITNGQNADPGAYPWQVALRRKHVYPWAPYAHMCGGSLVSSCWVVTAAHCVLYVGRHKKNFVIRVGDLHNGDNSMYKMDEDQQTFDIEHVIVHPDFKDRPVPKNDVALIKLVEKHGRCARYGEYVNSVCLPEPGQDVFATNTECHITGWGAKNWTDRPRDYPHVLQYGKIRLHDFNTCKELYGRDPISNISQISEGMICAGAPGIDTCQGDSGGPLVCERGGPTFGEDNPFVLWGITSWGHGCADSVKPGVYADVTKYIDWIQKVRSKIF